MGQLPVPYLFKFFIMTVYTQIVHEEIEWSYWSDEDILPQLDAFDGKMIVQIGRIN